MNEGTLYNERADTLLCPNCMRAFGQETDGLEQDGYRGFGLSFHLVKVPLGGRCVVCGSPVS